MKPVKLLYVCLLAASLGGCVGAGDTPHVQNDPGGGASSAVSSDQETHASGSIGGFGTADGDPITNSGNLGSGSTASDPMIGVNQSGPCVPF